MSQFLFHVQRTIGDTPSIMGLVSYVQAQMQPELETEAPVLIVCEVWRRKIMKETADLWAKSISKLEHMKFKDFGEMTTGLIQKSEELKHDDECSYELFVEAVVVYLKPITEIFDSVAEPPLYYNVTQATQTLNEKVQELKVNGPPTPEQSPEVDGTTRKDVITEEQWKEVQQAWDKEIQTEVTTLNPGDTDGAMDVD